MIDYLVVVSSPHQSPRLLDYLVISNSGKKDLNPLMTTTYMGYNVLVVLHL